MCVWKAVNNFAGSTDQVFQVSKMRPSDTGRLDLPPIWGMLDVFFLRREPLFHAPAFARCIKIRLPVTGLALPSGMAKQQNTRCRSHVTSWGIVRARSLLRVTHCTGCSGDLGEYFPRICLWWNTRRNVMIRRLCQSYFFPNYRVVKCCSVN